MTYQTYCGNGINNASNLANKLRNEYCSRGSDVSGMQASSTSELVRRAAMGKNPRVNCADQAFRENYRAYENTKSFTRVYSDGTMGMGATATSTRTETRKSSASSAPRTASASRGRSCGAQRNTQTNHRRATGSQERARRAQTHKVRFEKITPDTEVRVQSKALSPMFIFTLFLTTVMVMLLVMNVSEIYSKTNRISQLEAELELLEKEAADIALRVEERTDIREIEHIATTQLGMVKEGPTQQKYVSLSNGERIEIFEDETKDGGEESGGVLLSSIFSSLGRFFDSLK